MNETTHPGPNSDRVNVTGADLTEDQLAALTPEQRTRLTSGEPLPIDPRSPLSDDPLVEAEPSVAAAEALDRVEGMGDGDGDGLMDHGTAGGEDRRETETGATTDEAFDARHGDGSSTEVDESGSEVSDTPLADGLAEPAPWGDDTSGR